MSEVLAGVAGSHLFPLQPSASPSALVLEGFWTEEPLPVWGPELPSSDSLALTVPALGSEGGAEARPGHVTLSLAPHRVTRD